MSSEPDIRSVVGDELRPLAPVREWRPRVWNGNPLEPSPDLVMVSEPRHPRCEAIRALRTRLLLARDSSPHRGMLAVTSPCPAEGRSELCADLAIAFAQLGRATVLVDADLRSPRQHFLFGRHSLPGLAQALQRSESPWVYGVEGLPSLAVLTSGGAPEDPLELLSAGPLQQILEGCRREYEFVVVDTPPATRYADALVIAAAVNRVLVVTRSQSTSFDALTDMLRQISATSAQVAGAVINRF